MEITEEMEMEIPDAASDTEPSEAQETDMPSDEPADETSGNETDVSGENQSGSDGQDTSETDAEENENDTESSGTDETEPGTEEDGLEEDAGADTPAESINVNGSILILPEGYEFDPETFGLTDKEKTDAETDAVLSPEQFELLSEQPEQVTEAVAVQTDVFYGGTAVISLMLGVVLGILLVCGFRLRRV